MKKLIFFMLFTLISVVSFSQAATFGTGSGTYTLYPGDFNATNTTEAWALVNAEQPFAATQDVQINLDSVSGTHTKTTVTLYGRKFTNSAWVSIGSASWWQVGNDSTVTISNTTPNRYRQYKLGVVGIGTGVTRVDWVEFKVYNQ